MFEEVFQRLQTPSTIPQPVSQSTCVVLTLSTCWSREVLKPWHRKLKSAQRCCTTISTRLRATTPTMWKPGIAQEWMFPSEWAVTKNLRASSSKMQLKLASLSLKVIDLLVDAELPSTTPCQSKEWQLWSISWKSSGLLTHVTLQPSERALLEYLCLDFDTQVSKKVNGRSDLISGKLREKCSFFGTY